MSNLVSGSDHAHEKAVVLEDRTESGRDVSIQVRSVRDLDERTRQYMRAFGCRMLAAARDMCIMAFIAFTYAALTNDAPKISKSPTAMPFFPKNSIVRDYYRGEISQAISSAWQSDIAFVMFYAPWDGNSQDCRKEFEFAAKYMQKWVTFLAVNCWQPDGECRNQYTKVYSWPVLVAYLTHGRAVQYNGPLSALHMIRFLQGVMEPFKRITGLDLHYLRQQYDAVIVANVNPRPGSVDYAIVYTTAIQFLERDPFQEIAFAINTQHSSTRKISIYTWNSTIVYLEDKWKSNDIINWILKTVWQVTVWASPNGSKSLQLSRYIQPGPALILFTPRNPLYESYDYYDMLHEVALEYHYCKNHSMNFDTYLLSVGIHSNRIANYKKFSQPCTISTLNKNKDVKGEIKIEKIPNVVTVSNVNIWKNNSYCIRPTNERDYCFSKEDGFTELKYDNVVLREKEQLQEMYDNMIKKQTISDKFNVENDYILESYKNVYRTSMLTGFNDLRSPKNLVKSRSQNKCRLKNVAEKFSPAYFSESIVNSDIKPVHDITGFGCKKNKSLSIIAMDTLLYHHFAESLNIDVLNRYHKTVAVIVEEKMESHYVLGGRVNDRTLREFIYKYYDNSLNRALYSSSTFYNRTHVYPVFKNNDKGYFVKELVTENFLSTVMKKNKAVVVLYHTKQCAFCSGVSYKFLIVAKLFSYVTNLEFARIDGELNSLPWEYSMESYPTILFFPDRRKSETRVFPKSTPINVTSLVNFVLTNLTPALKIHAMWSLCNQSKFEEENQKCISSIRLEILSLIERTLQEWRKADIRYRPFLLNKLRTMRTLHLFLAHSNDATSVQKLFERLQRHKSDKSPA